MFLYRTITALAVLEAFAASAHAKNVLFQNPLMSNISLLAIICTVADRLFSLLLVIGVIAFLGAAFLYLTAGGNQQKTGTARKMLTAAIIGVVFAILAYGVPSMIASLFNIPASSLPASCT